MDPLCFLDLGRVGTEELVAKFASLLSVSCFCETDEPFPFPSVTGTDDDPSDKPFTGTEVDFVDDLVDSDKAGHESAPMTGPNSAAVGPGLSEGSFHAVFLPTLPFSEFPSSAIEDRDEEDEEGTTSGATAMASLLNKSTDSVISDSPRTISFHGGEAVVLCLPNRGLLTAPAELRGE